MKIILFFFASILLLSGSAQELNWTSIHDIEDSMSEQVKPILVKIETPWCGYCKMMDKKVFLAKKIRKELVQNYYYIKLNAEENQIITLNDTTYNYKLSFGRNGIQKLAEKWAKHNGTSIKYPTTIVLDDNYQIVKFLDGYLPKQNFYYWLTGDE